jgi:hypothetical protein
MPVIIDGTNGITQAGEFNSDSSFGFKNRIIDGGFTINQRGYVSGTSLSSGSYGHDRWKGGASGGTYTFTQASAGVNTTITITAGSIIQVIEGANLPEGGTYVLSWTGTAQGKIGAGSFGASGITGTITAGTNTNIEFNTGTCGNVQLEVGSTATSFDYRPYTTELALAQRYFWSSGAGITATVSSFAIHGSGAVFDTDSSDIVIRYPVNMRTVPTVTFSNVACASNSEKAVTAIGDVGSTLTTAFLRCDHSSGFTAGYGAVLYNGNNANGFVRFSSEL